MASDLGYVEYVFEQLGEIDCISYKKMFGDYCVYYKGKVIGLICDDQFFVKKTKAGQALLPEAEEGSPYDGAKPHIIVDFLEDKALLIDFITQTYDELPLPKPKKKKKEVDSAKNNN